MNTTPLTRREPTLPYRLAKAPAHFNARLLNAPRPPLSRLKRKGHQKALRRCIPRCEQGGTPRRHPRQHPHPHPPPSRTLRPRQRALDPQGPSCPSSADASPALYRHLDSHPPSHPSSHPSWQHSWQQTFLPCLLPCLPCLLPCRPSRRPSRRFWRPWLRPWPLIRRPLHRPSTRERVSKSDVEERSCGISGLISSYLGADSCSLCA